MCSKNNLKLQMFLLIYSKGLFIQVLSVSEAGQLCPPNYLPLQNSKINTGRGDLHKQPQERTSSPHRTEGLCLVQQV